MKMKAYNSHTYSTVHHWEKQILGHKMLTIALFTKSVIIKSGRGMNNYCFI